MIGCSQNLETVACMHQGGLVLVYDTLIGSGQDLAHVAAHAWEWGDLPHGVGIDQLVKLILGHDKHFRT
jgi:hypothetical protein